VADPAGDRVSVREFDISTGWTAGRRPSSGKNPDPFFFVSARVPNGRAPSGVEVEIKCVTVVAPAPGGVPGHPSRAPPECERHVLPLARSTTFLNPFDLHRVLPTA
jgi:hypothetical protein